MLAATYTWPWGQTWLIVGITLAVCVVSALIVYPIVRLSAFDRAAVPRFWTYWTIGLTSLWLTVGAVVAVSTGVTHINEQKKTARGLGDAPRPAENVIDGRPVDGITEMADNFPNVATKCVWDGWRVFVTSNGDHLFVVPDEKCRHKNTGPSN